MNGYNFYLTEKLAEIFREERMRAAEMARLTHRMHAQKPKRISYLGTVLVWLGKQMLLWGMRLQNNHIPAVQIPGEVKEVTG